MEIEKSYYDVYDVIKLLGVSKSKAYAVMREMNDYLEEQGYLVISGKVPARYFNEKWYGGTPVSYTHLDVYKRQRQMALLPYVGE